EAKCILLGAYVYGSEEAFKKAVHGAGMEAHIDFLGEVPFEEVPAHIAVSKIGLILFQPIGLGHTLGMPHKLFDYMREGIPVIAPAFCVEIKRIIEEADCGVLVEEITSGDAIAEAILGLLQDPEEAQRLGENGRKAVETTYNWQKEEEKLLAVFDSLA
ncbi:MAG TPA: glycosyltransferase, partial [Candidatus Hydrogenedentes bacterium]|nr:glycosyltransferase [Candidatus Hydrogenedentota bacterium]